MRARVVLVLTAWVGAVPLLAREPQPDRPAAAALHFFERLPHTEPAAMLRAIRPHPITPAQKASVAASLPPDGELTPTRDEMSKLEALRAVLVYHERERIDIKIIDVPWAFMGLHQRAFLLVSRPAVRLMSRPHLQAMAAHEVGHEFLWHEFEQSLNGGDVDARQRLELQCDGIAVLTLAAMGADPATLLTAVKRQVRYNEQFGTPKDEMWYPDIHERERFVRAVLDMTSAGRPECAHLSAPNGVRCPSSGSQRHRREL